ncbi:MAG: hypothetical protein EOP11_08190 [Proteobacteria bacterium]|nr:MAG: hypothetical protein EOP11_08190 [Pseudomonadota bacterium]
MSFLLLLSLLLQPFAQAHELTCNVTSRDGLYAGGTLTIRQEKEVEVKWRGETGGEESILGGSKVCGLETQARRDPVLCASTFTNPTPRRRMISLCRSRPPGGGSAWVGTLDFVVKMENGEGQLSCRTSLGAYTDFRLSLAGCREL